MEELKGGAHREGIGRCEDDVEGVSAGAGVRQRIGVGDRGARVGSGDCGRTDEGDPRHLRDSEWNDVRCERRRSGRTAGCEDEVR